MDRGTKLNHLLQQIPSGAVLLSSWLFKKGYSYELQQRYRNSGWLISIGKGAMRINGQNLTLDGAIYALQKQADKKIHIGGRTALSILGLAHYLEISARETILFSSQVKKLPEWIKNNTWDKKPLLITTSFLPPDKGLTEFEELNFRLKISEPARAIMECIELSPDRFDLNEVSTLMEGLNMLKPGSVQSLLESCRSFKVKRLFLYFAEKAGHSWFKYLNLNNINLGSGKRSIVKNGSFVPGYQITLPKNLV